MELYLLITLWIVLSILFGMIGRERELGFLHTFLVSLILSPAVGLILALSSKRKSDKEYEQKVLKTLNQILNELKEKK